MAPEQADGSDVGPPADLYAIGCVLTSNLRRAKDVGNVALEAGEGGLPKPSVVNVS